MVNGWMALLADELRDDGIPDPLGHSFTLAAVWDDLCRLAGEETPTPVRALLEDPVGCTRAAPCANPRAGADVAGSPRQGDGLTVNLLLADLVAELEAEDVPGPLTQSLTLGLVWADLCRLAAEALPVAVLALLDRPPNDAMHASALGGMR
jgi:hypothetical protein